MVYEIHQHPEWEYVEKWFKDRVGKLYPASDESALYHHIERIAFDVLIDELVEKAACDLSYRAGQIVSELASSSG